MMSSKKNIVIIGASGFAKEVAWLVEECGHQVLGYLDDNVEKGSTVYGYEVLGKVSDYMSYIDSEFLIGIGNPRIKKFIAHKMDGANFATMIDPSVKVSKAVKIDAGAIICAGNIITTDIHIGKHCHLNLNCTVGHDSIIGDFSTIAPQAVISGNVTIGMGVEIGTGAAIRQGVTLGEGSMLGMGGVLTKNTSPNKVYIGSPAKEFKDIESF